ncbi:hypothetical protein N9U05_00040 [bacterium]|jgi:hypothetical protein|nr:hypothetical protein [bacterium]
MAPKEMIAQSQLDPEEEMRMVVLLRALVVSKLLTSVLDDPLNQPMIILSACGAATSGSGSGGGRRKRGGSGGCGRGGGDDETMLFTYLQQQLTLGKASSSQQYCSEVCMMQLVSALGLVVMVLQEENKENNTGQCFETADEAEAGEGRLETRGVLPFVPHLAVGNAGAAVAGTEGKGAHPGAHGEDKLLLPPNFIVMANSRRSHVVPYIVWFASAAMDDDEDDSAAAAAADGNIAAAAIAATSSGGSTVNGHETDVAARTKQMLRLERQLGQDNGEVTGGTKGKGKGTGKKKGKERGKKGKGGSKTDDGCITDALKSGGVAGSLVAKVKQQLEEAVERIEQVSSCTVVLQVGPSTQIDSDRCKY